ncbi:hypothetical protein HELRODRAFT_184466, partial [Helobdella robusta]|uniref:Uncharacterized protein n=1 Tax=Helobdella robusta TaxID=6412 RepID=T1FL94_HELRO
MPTIPRLGKKDKSSSKDKDKSVAKGSEKVSKETSENDKKKFGQSTSTSSSSNTTMSIVGGGGYSNESASSTHPPVTQLNRINPLPETLKLKKEKRTDSSHFNVSKNRELMKLPLLKEASANDKETLLIQKLNQTLVIFDFVKDPLSDLKYKEIKRAALNELIEYISTSKAAISENVYPIVIQM